MKKKLLALLFAGCMVLSMTACQDTETKEPEEATENGTEEGNETSALGTSKLVELGQYKGVTYTLMDTTVTDEEVEDEVKAMVSSSYEKENIDTVTETSYVNIDYVGMKDGVAFDGGSAQSQELSIENSGYIEGFAESIVGMKVGETKDCPMTFPEDYGNTDLAGADVVFTITVNACWNQVPSELNDEFAAKQGYENVDALYAGVRENIETSKQQQAESDKQSQLIDKVIKNSTFDINEEEITLYVNDLNAQYEMYASYYGVDLETYVTTLTGMTMEQYNEEARATAIFRIQAPLVQVAIAEAEKLEVTEEVYQEKAAGYVSYYGYTTLEELEETYGREAVESQVIADLALEFIVNNAVEE